MLTYAPHAINDRLWQIKQLDMMYVDMFLHEHIVKGNSSRAFVMHDFGLIRNFTEEFLAQDVIYTSRAYAMMSVSICLSVCPSVCDGSALAHYN